MEETRTERRKEAECCCHQSWRHLHPAVLGTKNLWTLELFDLRNILLVYSSWSWNSDTCKQDFCNSNERRQSRGISQVDPRPAQGQRTGLKVDSRFSNLWNQAGPHIFPRGGNGQKDLDCAMYENVWGVASQESTGRQLVRRSYPTT